LPPIAACPNSTPCVVNRADGVHPEEVNSWAAKDPDFQIGPRRLRFTAENFHFHAVTAYDILRMKGAPLGKRDYEGELRTQPA
jgi:uncharacterized protein